MGSGMPNGQAEVFGEEHPLAMLFTDGGFLDESLYKSKDDKIAAFVNLCKMSSITDASNEAIIRQVVQNAIQVEFSPAFLEKEEMIDTIVDALNSDLIIKEEALQFAHRYFQSQKIDGTLIN